MKSSPTDVSGTPAQGHGEHHIGVSVGAPAPDFVLADQDNNEFRLSAYRGKRTVALLFYPLDWSPTDQKEQAALAAALPEFGRYAEVAAISVDSLWSHRAFAKSLGLKHRLLSDMLRGVSRAYGLLIEPLNFSQRATVLVDTEGNVAWFKVQPNPSDPRDQDEILQELRRIDARKP